jgi:major membrane immunogen (membrane-anchored lipoprotein)
MIKKIIFVCSGLFLVAFSANMLYKDGIYQGSSRSIYTTEPYYGQVAITVKNGKFTHVDFFVRDSAKHEYFDETYEKYFAGNDEYVNQCRNDWKGVQSYPDSLLKYQDVNKVDAISGATWSYNLFKASVNKALIEAEKFK